MLGEPRGERLVGASGRAPRVDPDARGADGDGRGDRERIRLHLAAEVRHEQPLRRGGARDDGLRAAEHDARIRLAVGRVSKEQVSTRIQTSGISIDESSYSAKVHGKPLDLTYKEFQLLHFFATHPSRVFTREQLLSEVWGYDYFGGTRTVDVHVRRLRAKLGDLEQLIGTVRNVGYRFVTPADEPGRESNRVSAG